MWCRFLFLFIAFGVQLLASEPKITVQIPRSSPNEPISGEIEITRLAWQQVDESSFTAQGEHLAVTKVQDKLPPQTVTLDSNAPVISTYSFSIPGKPQGLYLFPALQVKIGDSYISSLPISYEVAGAVNSGVLGLEARVAEKGPFYPGQKLTFQYLISFQSPIQLTKEKLPLLEFPGFRTVGAPKIEDYPQGGTTIQLISQTAVALEAGTFNSGESFIQGNEYRQDPYGNKVTSPNLIQATAPNVEVVVIPFPKEGMPASFNGAIGDFYWNVKPISLTNIAVGEKIVIQVAVSGSGDYDTVQFPDLSKQKGFKDLFRLSDLSPVGEMKNGQKRFTVNMRPLVSGVKMIPAIEFSSFDPITKTYVTRKSDPIAISVRPGKASEREPSNLQGAPPPVWPIEVQGNIPLQPAETQTRKMQDVLILYAAIFLVAAFAVQAILKKLWLESKEKGKSSREIMLEAIKQKQDPSVCCQLLRKALLLKLYEAHLTPTLVDLPEELKSDGLQGEIRSLLLSIEQKRFMGLEAQLEIKEIINEASQLFYRMK